MGDQNLNYSVVVNKAPFPSGRPAVNPARSVPQHASGRPRGSLKLTRAFKKTDDIGESEKG